jgi:hypothetical protein
MTVVLLLAATAATAATAQTDPEGFPDPGAPLVDPDFKVGTRQFGLDRRVEMYQWRLGENGYERVWHGALIDSAGFDSAHANPPTNFSRLPANLAASFQPEGEGLGSAENPLEPQVGDVRVSWRELVLPPLAGKVIQRDGTWVLVKDPEDADNASTTETSASTKPGHAQRVWPFFAGGLLIIAAIVVAVQRRRRRHPH